METKLIHSVKFNIREDKDFGTFGFGLVDDRDELFNTTWQGFMIFHDVFEHYFEGKDKYFVGDASYNAGGEITAMGACAYYCLSLQLYNRIVNNYRGVEENICTTALMEIENGFEGRYMYGDRLICEVPKQKKLWDESAEYCVELCSKMLSEIKGRKRDEEDKNYIKSVTKGKITDLFRYGYNMAETLVPCNNNNLSTLHCFIEWWNEFLKHNSVDELQYYLEEMKVNVYRDEEGNISWDVVFTPFEGEAITMNEDSNHYLEFEFQEEEY